MERSSKQLSKMRLRGTRAEDKELRVRKKAAVIAKLLSFRDGRHLSGR